MESRFFACGSGDRYLSVVVGDDGVTGGQTDADALAHRLGGEKWFEKFVLMLAGYAQPLSLIISSTPSPLLRVLIWS